MQIWGNLMCSSIYKVRSLAFPEVKDSLTTAQWNKVLCIETRMRK